MSDSMEVSGRQESVSSERRAIYIYEEAYERLIEIAHACGFQAKGKISINPLFDAISELDPEVTYDAIRKDGLLPKKRIEKVW